MNRSAAIRAIRTALLLWLLHASLRAEQLGNLYYTVNGNTVAITGTTENIFGAITIPAVIGGRRVTEVGGFMYRRGVTSVSIPEGVTTLSSGAFFACFSLTSMTIPESVTTVGAEAFLACKSLTSISIPEKVTSIGESAFTQCAHLTAIGVSPLNPNYSSLEGVLFDKNRTTLIQFPGGKLGAYATPGSVTSIGKAAFKSCGGLTSVSIPGSVTGIGDSAFSECIGLTSVSIPGSVTSIGHSACSGCTGLISVSIPASLITIGGGAFGGCTSLAAIEVDPLNPNYSSLDGVLFNKSRTTLIQFPTARAGAWSIPGSITEIPGGVFANCTGLTSVVIPGTVTSIPEYTFLGCTSLASLTIPDSITSIGERAFAKCTGLTSVTFGSGLTETGSAAFEGCTGLTSVSFGPNVTKITNSSFKDCTGLTSITIADSVTRIDSDAFQGCAGLTSVSIGSGVSAIGGGAFSVCTSLASASIPHGVTSIGPYAFTGCTGLTSVAIGNGITEISYGLFAGCTGLASVSIPDGVTTIADRAFLGCTGLNSVSFGSGVTALGWLAFMDCTGLTSITIPQNLADISSLPFPGCTVLTAIEVSPQNPNYSSLDGVLFNKGQTRLLKVPPQRSGTYPVPDTVLEIDSSAFEGCAALTSILVPGSVTSMRAGFADCQALTRIDVDSTNTAYSSLSGVLFNKDRTALIRYPAAVAGAYAVPAGVTAISGGAFYGCADLTSIAFPAGITSIGGYAFGGCTELTSVPLPAGLTGIGEGFFNGCTGLTSVSIPGSVTSIDAYAFEGCAGLTSISIPNSVTWIGYAAFRGCTSLASITIGRGVTGIEIEAFSGCTGLTGFTVDALNSKYRSLDGVLFSKSPFNLLQFPAQKAGHYTIPNGVIEVLNVNRDPFEGCAALTSVSIPASITNNFGVSHFRGCRQLTTITVDPLNQHLSSPDGVLYDKAGIRLIRVPAGRTGSYTVPATVSSIEQSSFEGCTGIYSVLFLGDNPSPDPTFADVAPGFTLYYFRGSFGFTSPTWQGYPAVMIDRALHPAAEWLFGYGLPYDADLQDDPNGDGVNLLMAYALNLDPNLKLRASLPVPTLTAENLSVSFYGISPGVIYAAETSTDLLDWTTAGVIVSAPGPDGRRSASVARDGPARHLRLVLRQ